MKKMLIGIGGCSNSGKSALAKQLQEALGQSVTKVVCQDDFVKYSSELPKIKGHVDWEQPSSIKTEELMEAVNEAREKFQFVIVEGLFAFWFDELNAIYDASIFLKLSKNVFLERKAKDLRWGKEPHWYMEYIYESYLKYGRPKAGLRNLIEVDAEKDINVNDLKNNLLQVKS